MVLTSLINSCEIGYSNSREGEIEASVKEREGMIEFACNLFSPDPVIG